MTEKNIIESEEDAMLPMAENRLVSAGIFGDTDPKAMQDRRRRVFSYFKKMDFREVIPCDKCMSCIEMRGFTAEGEMETIGYVCLRTGGSTDCFHTCNEAHRSSGDRKKVIYDKKNAPMGFEEGLVQVPFRRKYTKRDRQTVEPSIPPEGYRGGSGYYKRADTSDVGSGIPKKLAN